MARNIIALKRAVSELDKTKDQIHQSLIVNFSDFQSFTKKIDSFFEKNKIDILVNNIQGPPAGKALEKYQ